MKRDNYYLGVFEGHSDPAVALVRGNQIIAYAEEERFNRLKHAFGMYPVQALRYCLQTAGIALEDISAVGVEWDLDGYSGNTMKQFYETVNSRYPVDGATKAWQASLLATCNRQAVEARHHFEWRKLFGDGTFPPIVGASHHYTHAFQAAMQSPFKESVCLTIDGSGDQYCTVVWEHRGSTLTPIHQVTIPHSLGWFYAAFTEYLGFEAYDGEYKVMGLAAYGHPNRDLLAKVGRVLASNPEEKHSYLLDPTYIHYGQHTYSHRYTDKLIELFHEKPRLSTDAITKWHEDLAYAVQYHLEQTVQRLVAWAVQKTGISQIVIGGGVGHNVKMNSAIFDMSEVSDVWANPLCSDGGTPIGSALLASYKATGIAPQKLKSLNLGYEETNEDIESALKTAQIPYQKSAHIAREVAAALSEGLVVGWFQGRMEGGPRALGQRSILADPRSVAARDKVNSIIKFREYWRPFCPSMLKEAAGRYFDHFTEAPFMVIAFKANERLQKEAPAVVHVDGTARVQLVDRATLPKYHAVIAEFAELTGVPVVLNTSFNVKGEPIVCTIKDALRTFWSSGLDVLAAGDFIVRKRSIS